jgi:hypothetical protein
VSRDFACREWRDPAWGSVMWTCWGLRDANHPPTIASPCSRLVRPAVSR